MKFNNKITNILAGCLLVLMFFLASLSMQDDSATMDELAHIPAGYSYISQKDMRINPEHPPLLKDLAGLSVWFGSKLTASPINFPSQAKSWQEGVNDQWDFGNVFLYQSNNNADQIIFWARLPMLLIMLLLGFYIFRWARELYGNRAGLLALFLYSLSPTFLAHSRYVTTDVGATAAFFIATYYLVKWLRQSSKKNLIKAGLVFGLAMLTKFSLVLLIPYFIFLAIVWGILQKCFFKTIFALALIGIIGMALIWPVYLFHTWDYPLERQLADTQFHFRDFAVKQMSDPVIWMADKPLLRPYGQFFLGFLMVLRRATGGNTTYFLGEVSNMGWHYYFPIVFLIKVPLAFLILILITLFLTIQKIVKVNSEQQTANNKKIKLFIVRCSLFIKNYFTEFALLSFLALYWATSITSNLNIGVRHVLPTFPILYLLISGQITKWLTIKDIGRTIKTTVFICLKTYFKYLILIILLFWYAFGTIKVYPNFLAYFNEAVGGASNGYKYVTDSNLDWGQDLKRLTQFVEENKINKIYVNYFGGGSAKYYLGEKFQDWWGDRNPADLPPNSWLAVSATLLQGGRAWPASGFNEKTDYYNWLNHYEPVTTIGHSIFVYRIPKDAPEM
ncbi:MAG: glycosyltransferase family 39 protein [Candidatus Portnoybacteria bacterium]|nr:glycosyltransferase family 39 protein [Candidatus Portnoybacteria bacterium]